MPKFRHDGGGVMSRAHVGGGRKMPWDEELRSNALEYAGRRGAAAAAAKFKVPVGTVRSWLARARRKREVRAEAEDGLEQIKREGQRIVTEHDRLLEGQVPRRLRPGEVLSGCSPEEAARYVGAVPWTAGAAPVEEVEPKRKPKRRRRRRKGASEAVANAVSDYESAPGAMNAAHDSLAPDDPAPSEFLPGVGEVSRHQPGPRILRREDGSEYTTTDPDVGPN
jgi:hypothetical protein